ncbi:MAG TPA: hypothetical protein DD730_04410 [Desulfosporosinus sp.]|jgi:hypothetical protein|nr:hypothetical protein [Desulfosporosinus sp.]
MISFLLSLFKRNHFTGVLSDTRPQEEKDQDVLHEEVASGTGITWTVKQQSDWKKYPKRDQDGSGSCVAHSNAHATGIERLTFKILSALDIYDRRSNKPQEGMIPIQGIKITCDHGVIPESLLPSQYMSEYEMNQQVIRTPDMIAQAEEFKGGTPITLPIDIDAIAQVLDQGQPVLLCLSADTSEWNSFPQMTAYSLNMRHNVTVVDRTIYQDQKCLIVDDSFMVNTTINGEGQRIISEDFILKRAFFAGYKKIIPPPQPIPKPNHIFTIDMRFGDRNNEVTALQDRLKSEGFFPNIPSTGYFGSISKKAVVAYQTKHNIPSTGFCGPLTRSALNNT